MLLYRNYSRIAILFFFEQNKRPLFISHRPLPPRDSRRLRRNRVIPVLRSLSNVVMIITIPAVNRHDCPSTASSTHTIFFIFTLPFLYMLILVCFVLLIQKEQIIFLLDLDNLLDLAYNRNRNSLLSYSFPEVFTVKTSVRARGSPQAEKGRKKASAPVGRVIRMGKRTF